MFVCGGRNFTWHINTFIAVECVRFIRVSLSKQLTPVHTIASRNTKKRALTKFCCSWWHFYLKAAIDTIDSRSIWSIDLCVCSISRKMYQNIRKSPPQKTHEMCARKSNDHDRSARKLRIHGISPAASSNSALSNFTLPRNTLTAIDSAKFCATNSVPFVCVRQIGIKNKYSSSKREYDEASLTHTHTIQMFTDFASNQCLFRSNASKIWSRNASAFQETRTHTSRILFGHHKIGLQHFSE